jgi:hypothetical protein
MQNTSSSAPVRVLTAHNVFDRSFNFEFLMDKAAHELHLSLTEELDFFYWNAMNFSVSVHAIADHLWWVKAIDDPQWNKHQGNFVNWVVAENDCIAAFLDISNTYKHSERDRPTQQNKVTEHLKLHPDDAVIKHSNPSDERELRNCIRDKKQRTACIYWPVITTKEGRLIYYRYAAESALDWWRRYECQ